jgi:hypothetical protein
MAVDKIVERNIQLLEKRSEKGIEKYGETLEGSMISFKSFSQHAIEEALDFANYLQKMKDIEEKRKEKTLKVMELSMRIENEDLRKDIGTVLIDLLNFHYTN